MNKDMEQKEIVSFENKIKLSNDILIKLSVEILSDFLHELNVNMLLQKIYKSDDVEFLKKLIDTGIDFKSMLKDRVGHTQLHDACGYNSLECAKFFIDNGADINSKNGLGSTPVYIACLNNSYECAKFLIERGADINYKNFFGNTIIKEISGLVHKRVIDLLVQNGAHE